MRLLALPFVVLVGLGMLACAAEDDPIAGDLDLGDDDDAPAATSSSSGGGTSSSGGSTSSGGSSSSSSSSGSVVTEEIGDTYAGKATFYSVDLGEQGNCSLPCPSTYLVAALNSADYAASALCGGCARVEGPDGSVVVQIWDQCPGCGTHGIDLSETAFGAIADPDLGRIDVSWTMVRCPWLDPVGYEVFSDRIQVRNHRVPIESVEIDKGSGYVPLTRRSDNFFTGSVPDADLPIRLTGTTGEVLEDVIRGRGSQDGAVQFE